MARSPSLCGVILAAGASLRMGRDKALLPWPPSTNLTPQLAGTFLGAHIESLTPHCEMVLVVTGANTDSLTPVIYSQGAFLVQNYTPELGQFSSLKVGLQDVLNRGRDAAIVALVDRPPVMPATMAALHAGFMEAIEANQWAAVPEFEGQHGHPYFAGRELIEQFLRAPLTTTARDVLHANAEHIRYVSVNDPAVSMNVNTPEEYEQLMRR